MITSNWPAPVLLVRWPDCMQIQCVLFSHVVFNGCACFSHATGTAVYNGWQLRPSQIPIANMRGHGCWWSEACTITTLCLSRKEVDEFVLMQQPSTKYRLLSEHKFRLRRRIPFWLKPQSLSFWGIVSGVIAHNVASPPSHPTFCALFAFEWVSILLFVQVQCCCHTTL